MDELDILKEVGDIWETSSYMHTQAEARWARNKRLVNSKHVTKVRAGQSQLFIPKIEAFHSRKQADYVAALGSDNPVSLKPTLNATKDGAVIMETLCNHYLSEAGIQWKAAVLNASINALTYNYSPFIIDWDLLEDTSKDMNGEVVSNTIYSHATLEVLPPEDLRIDPAIGWDEVGQARFGVVRRWRDKAYARRMAQEGLWPDIEDAHFGNQTTDATSTGLKAERSQFGTSMFNDTDLDNGLLEVWETYNYMEDSAGTYRPMRTVTIRDQVLLEEPRELEIDLANQDGSDPWPFGIARIYAEPHEIISRALPERLEQLQLETNAIRNQRRDNVALVLNREKFMTSDAGVDPATLSRSYAGKVTVVRSKNSVWWDTPPDITASGYNEENAAVSDMERLIAESATRVGGIQKGANTATESRISAANSDMAVSMDVAVFRMTFGEVVVRKLIKMIKQAAPVDMFEKAAAISLTEVEDPYIEAIKGAYKVTVGAGAQQASKDLAISNASNMAAIIQSVYGPQANYYPILAPMMEANGLNPEEILKSPQQQQPNPLVQQDAGGVDGQDNLTVQPNVALTGGQFGANAAGG